MPSKEPIDRDFQRAMRMDRLAQDAFPSGSKQEILRSLSDHIQRIKKENPELKRSREVRRNSEFIDQAHSIGNSRFISSEDQAIIRDHLNQLKTLKEYYKEIIMNGLLENQEAGGRKYYADKIQRRSSFSLASGVDSGGREDIIKGSPLDSDGQSPMQYADNLRKHDPNRITNTLRDPLNIRNTVDAFKSQAQSGRAPTSAELNRRDLGLMKDRK